MEKKVFSEPENGVKIQKRRGFWALKKLSQK
jgi:hypothetical protein